MQPAPKAERMFPTMTSAIDPTAVIRFQIRARQKRTGSERPVCERSRDCYGLPEAAIRLMRSRQHLSSWAFKRRVMVGALGHAHRSFQPGEAAEPASKPPSMFTSVPVT